MYVLENKFPSDHIHSPVGSNTSQTTPLFFNKQSTFATTAMEKSVNEIAERI